MTIEVVACLWEWDAGRKAWLLRRITVNPTPSTVSDLWPNDVGGVRELEPARAVTRWTHGSGARLCDWMPAHPVSSLSPLAGKALSGWERWPEVIEGGADLLERTALEAGKLVTEAARHAR